MLTRISLLFALTTDPQDKSIATAHSGGWSEGYWANAEISSGNNLITRVAQARAALLPGQASVIGYRLAKYNIGARKLLPLGTSTGKFFLPGNESIQCDVPQMALELSGSTNGGPNTNRFTLRGIPDVEVARGEFQPSAGFKAALTRFKNRLIAEGLGFIGRDYDGGTRDIYGLASSVLTVSPGGFSTQEGDLLQFIRVRDANGDAISGSFLIDTKTDDTHYVMRGLGGKTISIPTGQIRLSAQKFYAFSYILTSRIVVRKIGRPFESYRGRQ